MVGYTIECSKGDFRAMVRHARTGVRRVIDMRGGDVAIDPPPPRCCRAAARLSCTVAVAAVSSVSVSVSVCNGGGGGAMVHSAVGPGAMSHRPDNILGIPKSPSFHSGLDLVSQPAMYQGLPVQLPSLLGQ
ncbi:hypothetical protein J6590_032102 [Homalodisca vitripennis]|nr:hypothetical protein J6590_032102 [Homalodisca vitripennis]